MFHKYFWHLWIAGYMLFVTGVVPEPTRQVEEAAEVELSAALSLPLDALTLPATPRGHHLLLPLVGAQRLFRSQILESWQFSGNW